MTQTAHGNLSRLQPEPGDHFKAADVETCGLKLQRDLVTNLQRGAVVRMAMDDRQGRAGLIVATTGKDGCSIDAEAIEALLPALMAPTQQMLKMHDASSIRVAETDLAAEFKPMGTTH